MRRVVLAVAALATACSAAPKPSAQSELHSDSGINGASYEDIVANLAGFAAKYPNLMQEVTYGTSTDGHQLTVFKIQDRSVQVAGKRPAVLISEAIHGNEYLDIADRLPREFIEGSANTSGFKQLLAKGGILYVVPVANPDGYTRGQRENANGVDLNRDYTIQAAHNQGFTQPETRAISTYVANEVQANNLTLEASMEYHCCFGSLIYPWNYDPTRALTGDLASRAQEVGSQVRQLVGYNSGNVRDTLGAGYENGAVGGSDDYYLETYGRRAFSFEGTQGSEYKNLAAHVQMWDFIFQRAVQGYTGGGTATTPPSSDLFLALADGTQSGTVQLEGSAPATSDGLDLCLGSQAQCAAGGPGVHVPATLTSTANGRRIYRAQNLVAAQSGMQVTLVATLNGQPVATRTVSVVGR